jgi:hypothetical protein
MDALSAEYDGPLKVALAADATRMEVAVAGTTETRQPLRRCRTVVVKTEGVFLTAAQALGTRNICASGFVAVNGSSQTPKEAANLPRIVDQSWDGIWRAVEGGFLEFDFLGKSVILTGYAIRVAQGKERSDLRWWIVQGWRDDAWIEIDKKEDDKQITPVKAWTTFSCGKGKGAFGKVKIVQTGPTSLGPGAGFGLTNVEFFGAVKPPEEP